MKRMNWIMGGLCLLVFGCSDENGNAAPESNLEDVGGEGGIPDVEPDVNLDVEEAMVLSDADAVEETTQADVEEEVDAETPPKPAANLVINEVVVKALDNTPDWIEIRNLGGITVDLEGWGIRDQLNAHEYLFPAGAEIPAAGYFVVWGMGSGFEFEMDFTFAVDAKARLFAPDQETLVDEADWEIGDAPEGTSWGRFPDGVGDFQTLTTPTQGQKNVAPATEEEEPDVVEPEEDGEEDGEETGPTPPTKVQINEVLVLDGGGANCWVEIYNPTDADVDLTDWYATPDALTVPLAKVTGKTVPTGGFALLECGLDFPFVLSEDGAFWLMGASGIKVDSIDWTALDVPVDQSYGRLPDGGEDWMTFALPTPGASNSE